MATRKRMEERAPTSEAVARGVLHHEAQVVVREQHLLCLHDVHMAFAQLRLDLHGAGDASISVHL